MSSAESTPQSLAERDRRRAFDVADLEQLMQESIEASDRPVKQMMAEVQKAGRGPGKINNVDYARYRMYEADKRERKEFMSNRVHWPIENIACDQELAAVTTDKWRCTRELESAGIETIPIIAMVDAMGADRSYGDTPVARTGDELAAFLAEASLPIFAKPNEALGSYGATRIESFDGTDVGLAGAEPSTPHHLVEQLMVGDAYVLQPVIENHPWVRAMCTGLATVRVANFVGPDGHRVPYATFKIPGSGNIADNFWRAGNLVAAVDVPSGEIERVVTDVGPRQQVLEAHPDSDQRLLGERVPFWAELLDLTERCAEHFAALRYHTLDIAITETGPIVVEVNSGGSFDLPQIASGRGLLTDENRAFFESIGVNFRKIEVPD